MDSKFYTNVAPFGNNLLVRSISSGGRSHLERVPYSPSVWTLNGTGETPFKTLDGKPCYRIPFKSIKDAKTFVEEYKTVSNFDVYGQTNFLYQYMWDTYPKDIQWDYDKIKIYSLDIETESEQGFPDLETTPEEILLITVQNIHTKKIITWGRHRYSGTGVSEYRLFNKENELILDFLSWWGNNTPDVITGWNVSLFDITYLYRRITKLIDERTAKKLSPWGLVGERTITIRGKKSTCYDITGISQLDYYDLYRKYTYSAQESYRLDNIASVELDVKKVDHSEFSTFSEFYKKDWNKFVEYNIRDTELVSMLEDKMKLIELQITAAYGAKINYEDVFSQVRSWDMLIHNHLRERNIIIPPKKENVKSENFEGAYVKDPIIGMHNWVVSFDLNSLYPHLIMQYNISPETLLDTKYTSGVEHYLKVPANPKDDVIVAANGTCYSKSIAGVFPQVMRDVYRERSEAKQEMLRAEAQYQKTKDPAYKKIISRANNMQMAMKIALNSAYGAMGNEYFRYFDVRMAEAITLGGQLAIRWIHDKINEYMNNILKTKNKDYIIAVDTDSIYVSFDGIVNNVFQELPETKKVIKFLDKICEDTFIPYINKCYEELASRHNTHNEMVMKRESIADRGLWTSKKRYILSVYNSEGVDYETPKLKIMGLEMIKSSTPLKIRKALRDAIPIILYKDQQALYDYIDKFREIFNTFKPEEIAFPRSCQGMNKYADSTTIYKLATPMHVRGSLLYNHNLKTKKLEKQYSTIKEGEKIKFLYLKVPNPIESENVISFVDVLPKEFNVHNYVDYDTQFQKVFLDALQITVSPLGWKTIKTSSLEDFF